MQRDSWPLLALLHAKQCRLSPVQVQKTLFLVGEYVAGDSPEFYRFEPYHYGPFDSDVYADLDALTNRGLVQKVESAAFKGFEYELTPNGIDVAQAQRRRLNDRQKAYLERVVPWVRSQSFAQLVKAIYKAFPHMRAKSVFRY